MRMVGTLSCYPRLAVAVGSICFPDTYLQLELSRHVLRDIAQYCLRAHWHILGAETECWQSHNKHCDKCGLN